MRTRLVPALVVLACATTASAQLSREQLLKAAYGARRSGDWDAATFAFEQALEGMPKSPEKKVLALELADLYRTTGRWEKAVLLFRKNHDIPREFEVMMERKQYDQALTLARLVGYPKGEGEALVYLRQYDEGLRVLERAGLHREQADLLYKLKRYEPAAEVYGRIPDHYWRARALERAEKADEARAAYEDALEGAAFDWREEIRPFLQRAQELFDGARDGISREQARLKLAEANGKAAELYEKLAVIYVKTGRRSKAGQLFDNAIRFLDREIQALMDQANGGCAFGVLKVEQLELRGKQEKLRQLKERMAGGSD